MHFYFPPKNSLCMIYKRFKLWGHWKCPHKSPSPCKTCHTHVIIQLCVLINHTHTQFIYIYNLHTHTRLFVLCEFFMLNFFISIFIYPLKDWTFYSQSLYKLQKSFDYYLSLPKKQVICRSRFLLHVQDCLRVFINVFAWQAFGKSVFSYLIFVL